jgi:hypothetical protein
LIVGGGIGGLAAALAVSRAGYTAHVIEKTEAFAELGAGLQLAPNATRVLDRLGLLDEIRHHAMFPKRLVMGDALSGGVITAVDLGRTLAVVPRAASPGQEIHVPLPGLSPGMAVRDEELAVQVVSLPQFMNKVGLLDASDNPPTSLSLKR